MNTAIKCPQEALGRPLVSPKRSCELRITVSADGVRKPTGTGVPVAQDLAPERVIDLLWRFQFVGRLHPQIIALMVPVEIALKEVQAELGAHWRAPERELTRNAFLSILGAHDIQVIRDIDHFCKLKEQFRPTRPARLTP